MDPDVAERAKWSIQEYAQRNSEMGWNRGCQAIQYVRGKTYSTTTRFMFAERRYELSQSWNKEGFISVDQELFMCKMDDPSTSKYSRVACVSAIKTKNDGEIAISFMSTKYKGTILLKNCKGQEGIFKSMSKFIVIWAWQNHPRRHRKNTYNYTLSHICGVIGSHYLRHLCADPM